MPSMPAIPLPAEDVKALAAYFRSVLATATRQGGPPPGPQQNLNVLVGDAAAGEKYFNATCAGCHSATGDLAGFGGRQGNPMQLQNGWLNAGGNARTATVTLPSGETVSGRVGRIDDFDLALTLEDGGTRAFTREGNVPKVEVFESPHRKLLTTYTDKDIHDVTAYLVTLK
jgi:cytochrome c oxidase cbb3-type subunit 3